MSNASSIHRTRFTRSVPAVAAGITSVLRGVVPKLKFSFTGPTRTDGQTIYTGEVPHNADERMVTMLWGNALHEVGHIGFSNFKMLNTLSPTWTPLQSGVHMSIEDTFMEGMLIEQLRGARHWLNESMEIMLELGQVRTGTGSYSDALSCFPLFWGCYCFNGFSCMAERYATTRAKLAEALEEQGVMRLEGLLNAEMPMVRTSIDAAELMQRYVDLAKEIEDEQEKDGDDPQQNDQSTDAGGQDPNGSQGDSGDDSDDDDSSTRSDGKPSVFDDEDNPDLEGHAVDWHGAMEEVTDQNVEENRRNGDTLMAGQASEFSGRNGRPSAGNADRYEELRSEVAGVVNGMANRLVRLMAIARTPSRKSSHKGRLRPSRVHRIFSGEPKIYRRNQYEEIPESCVSVVVDLSGSMSENGKERIASTVLVALGEALARVQIPFEATAFGNDFWVAKSFDEPFQNAKRYLGGLDKAISGTTPLGNAMHESALRLIQRPEARKILICLTDGVPDDRETVMRVDQGLNADGIQVLGIGIGERSVERLFMHSSVVLNPSDLGPSLLGELTPRLLKRAS